ncbi:n-acetylglutamate synthase [Persicobacter diffluens]|uniref:N-acetylglutamate synthase n=1 Tax=Persicobacter diffluens TaxID=981 RepID=A0AAN5AMH1_9BACT|nr:hypothetical protein PEDI_43590 [Persicobacter diffluens]
MINYQNKKFKALQNSDTGEVSGETIFHYQQEGSRLWATYSGGAILEGHLMGKVDKDGRIEMVYHHRNREGELKSGVCHSMPEILKDGKIRLFEKWQWTFGGKERGTSILEEI